MPRALAIAFALLLVLAASASAIPPDKPKRGHAHDCTGEARRGGLPDRVGYVVWCGTEIGRFSFELHPEKGFLFPDFERAPAADGRGSVHCRRHASAVLCKGRTRGPLTVNGWVEVPQGTECTAKVAVELPFLVSRTIPVGCPGQHAWHPHFDYASIRSFRRQADLDPDLEGRPRALHRRIRGTIAAWRRGEPVARWTMDNVGVPLRPQDQRELDFQETYINADAAALERWVPKHARKTYAGYAVGDRVFYIGFVGDQWAQIRAFERSAGVIAKSRIRPFPVQPTHSARELRRLESELIEDEALRELLIDVGEDVLGNKVSVGTEKVAKLKRLIAERYGPQAPIEVHYEEPGEFLAAVGSSSDSWEELCVPLCGGRGA